MARTLFSRMFQIALVLCMITMQDAKADSWNSVDKSLIITYSAMDALDVKQSDKEIDRGIRDVNPIYGSNSSEAKVVLTRLVAAGVVYWLADTYPEYRRSILIEANIFQGISVSHNYSSVKFSF